MTALLARLRIRRLVRDLEHRVAQLERRAVALDDLGGVVTR